VSGGIRNLTDLVTGNVLISDDGHRPLLEMQVEKPHWMSAWNVAHAMPGAAQQVTALWHKVEGPYMTVVEVVAKCGSSQFTIQYTLDCVSPVLRISLNIDWMEKGSIETGIPALRMALPLNLKQARLATEIPFGFCGRELNHDEEVPALRSLYVLDAAGERPAGIMLANDCKYGYALEGNTLRASLLRSPFDPDRFPELGEHQCSFALAPAPADAVESRTAELGRSFNHPLKVIATDCHRGEVPNTGSFLSCSSTDVIFSAIKKAEDGDGIIIRFYTTTEITAPITITFSSVFGALAEARKVNLMEEAAGEECVKLEGNVLQLPPLSKGIYSFRIRG
ncbi:MAG: hypothetical protein J6S21_03260, partial [Victivallales bacterium]|nr:hypothetical protein [Victivallales bacterium]